jgi:hypothetical protein
MRPDVLVGHFFSDIYGISNYSNNMIYELTEQGEILLHVVGRKDVYIDVSPRDEAGFLVGSFSLRLVYGNGDRQYWLAAGPIEIQTLITLGIIRTRGLLNLSKDELKGTIRPFKTFSEDGPTLDKLKV